jgi:hypothetical protein
MINDLHYTFEPLREQKRYRRYRHEELSRMTTMQLMDICEREGIIHAAVDRLDSQELIHLIMQFRGSRTPHLILEEKAGGQERLSSALKKMKIREKEHSINISGKIVAYEGLDTNLFDKFSMPYASDLDGVNAVIVDNSFDICAIFQVSSYHGVDGLYLTRSGKLPCRTADIRDYKLLLFHQELSDMVYRVYTDDLDKLPPEGWVYVIPLLDFLVLKPAEAAMPLVVDFGTTNTTAGFYIDNFTYEKIKEGVQEGQITPCEINHVKHITPDGEIVPVLPTVIGVERIQDGKAIYNFGHDAEKMIFDGYINDGFCVFYDIKRWVSDYNRNEELSDYEGNRILVSRKDIIREYLQFIIKTACQRFKCKFESVFFSYPVKQRAMFMSLYNDAVTDIRVLGEDTLDEGVSALYGTIRQMAKNRNYEEHYEYKSLILDCGGGTTDLSTCKFKIANERVSHNIKIETTYENGDTDFGGNNLTFRIMQLIKIAAAREISGDGISLKNIAAELDIDIYSVVENQGVKAVYTSLDEAYATAEQIIPTKFKDYEYKSRDEYYKVRNNMYFLFALAERVKKEFFSNPQILQISVGDSQFAQGDDYSHVHTPRWKFAANVKGRLTEQKTFPYVVLSAMFIKVALHGDIYNIVHQFFEGLYKSNELRSYNIIHLTGQSCKIDIFRDALKEYLPGKLVRKPNDSTQNDYRLKLSCLDGAIRYVSDKRMGHTKVSVVSRKPALPYMLTAFTHTDKEEVLLQPLNRKQLYGSISRSINSVELRLYLLNAQGEKKYEYAVYCDPSSFTPVTYEEIERRHNESIPQSEVDVIENDEVRYFISADSNAWGFIVVPVSRQNEQLYIGAAQQFPFENENWLINYFDGTW